MHVVLINLDFDGVSVDSLSQLVTHASNLTSYALSVNLETGVFLGSAAAKEALSVIDSIIEAKCVCLVFRAGLNK